MELRNRNWNVFGLHSDISMCSAIVFALFCLLSPMSLAELGGEQISSKQDLSYEDTQEWHQKYEAKDADEMFRAGNKRFWAQEYKEAEVWYRRASNLGLAPAQHQLASMYETGRGVKKDYHEAVKWFQLAADAGYAPAQYQLGNLYQIGKGVAVNSTQARKWHQRAGEQDYSEIKKKFAVAN